MKSAFLISMSAMVSLFAAGGLIAQTGNAQAPATADISTQDITSGEYTADPAHTLVGFRVNHMGFNDYFGVFGNASGSLNLDMQEPENSSVTITVPVQDLAVASADLKKHMMSADFFDAANYPNVTFTSTSVVVEGTSAKITGDLTIRGITKPVTLDARLTGTGANPMTKKQTLGFEGETEIDRTSFGMDYGVPMVPATVALGISAAFEKAD